MDRREEFHLIRTTYNPQSYRRRQSSYQNAASDPRRSERSNWRVRSESSSMMETSDPYLHKTTNTNSQKGQMRNEVPIYNSQVLNAAGYMNLDDRIARGPRMASDGRPMVVSTQNAGKVNNSVNIPPVNQNPSSQTMKSSAMGRVTNNSSKRAQVTIPVENREVVRTMDNNKNVRNIPEVQKNCHDKGKSVMGSVDLAPAVPKPFPRSNQVVGTINNKNVPNIPEVQKNYQDKGKSVMGSVDQAPAAPKPIPQSNQVVGIMDNNKNVHNIPEVQNNCQDKGKSVMGSVDQAPAAPKPFPQSFHLTRNGFPLIYRIEGANWTYAPLKEFTRVSSDPNLNQEQQGKTPGSSAANETTGERMGSSGQNPLTTATPYDSFTMGLMKEALRYGATSRDVFLYPELYLPADLAAELNM